MLELVVNNILQLVLAANKAYAETVITNPSGSLPKTANAITSLVSRVQSIVSVTAGVLAVAMLIWGGFLYATSAGDEERNKTAKKVLTYAVGGIIIILLANVLIVMFIKALGGSA